MEMLKQLIDDHYAEEEVEKLYKFWGAFQNFLEKYKLNDSLFDLKANFSIDLTITSFANKYTVTKDVEERFDGNDYSLTISMYLSENEPENYELNIGYSIDKNGEVVVNSVDFSYGEPELCKDSGRSKKIGTNHS